MYVEQVQKGMNSPMYSVEQTAKRGESTVRQYQEIILSYITNT